MDIGNLEETDMEIDDAAEDLGYVREDCEGILE